MANLKETLDYFPHMERSRPMELIGAEFKEKGDSVMWTIFEEIYIRGNGYFCEWNNDVALMFINRPWLSVGVPAVSEILNSMLRRGILDKALFDKYGILTSKEIQEIYFEAVRRRKKIAARYGELSGMDQALDGTADFDKAFDESLWLIALLANSYVEYYNRKNKDNAKEPLTVEDLEVITLPGDFSSIRTAIYEAMNKGMKRSVESESDPKNAEVG